VTQHVGKVFVQDITVRTPALSGWPDIGLVRLGSLIIFINRTRKGI
jgi:hypothetical protein